MIDCPDAEELVRLEEATAWKASERLAHITQCAECTAMLRGLEGLASVRTGLQPDAGFESRVNETLRVIRLDASSAPTGMAKALLEPWRRPSAPVLLVFALATMSAFLLLMMSTWISVEAPAATSRGITSALAVVAGAFAAWRASRVDKHPLRLSQPL